MDVRRAGSSDLPITPIGLGLAALGRPGYLNIGHDEDLGDDRSVATMEAHAHSVLDAAYDAGVRYIDAARSYGLAEAFLASWLDARRLGPGDLTVASKWGYTYTADWRVDADAHEVKDHSPEALARQVGESREILGPHLDVYQIHSATLDTGVLTDREVLERLAALAADDVHLGFTVSGPGQAAAIEQGLEAEVDGQRLFSVVQATWNPLEPSAGDALAAAHDGGLVVVIKEAVANGRLTMRNEDPSIDTRLGRVARRHGVSHDAVALAAALAQPFVDVVLSGAANVEQLSSNLAAEAVDLTTEELAYLEALTERPEIYWATRSALPWR